MKHKGFTLIEVALFLGLTGLLFVGIVAGTSNSIYQQRFTDSVQNYAEFLRSIYSEVSNPQSVGDGRSEVAIYGKLITFGQNYGLDGAEIDQTSQRIYVYDVIGDVVGTADASSDVTTMLKTLKANVIKKIFRSGDESSANPVIERVEPAGLVDVYTPRWGAGIETTDLDAPFEGSILVVRHPKSGTINTLIYAGDDGIIEVNQAINYANEFKNFSHIDDVLQEKLSGFETMEIDFCIDPEGIGIKNEVRRDIRLVKNARNASGVEVIELDALDEVKDGTLNKCRVSS